MQERLNHGPARRVTSGNALVITAAICGALPLIAGIAIFIAWTTTRLSVFELLGFLTIVGGLFLFVIGMVCLASYHLPRLNTIPSSPTRWGMTLALPLILLLINFPVAVAALISVRHIKSAVKITVVNRSASTVKSVALETPDGSWTLNDLAPGAGQDRTFHFATGKIVWVSNHGGRTDEHLVADWFDDDARAFVNALEIIVKDDKVDVSATRSLGDGRASYYESWDIVDEGSRDQVNRTRP